MSTIRPLATIAVLAALGVFLALEINKQGPVSLDTGWDSDASPYEEAPSFQGMGSAAVDSSAPSEAPVFDPSQASVTPRTAPAAAATGLPSLPELPPMPNATGAAPVPNNPTTTDQELQLPAIIPQARYDGASTTGVQQPTQVASISGSAPSLGTSSGIQPPTNVSQQSNSYANNASVYPSLTPQASYEPNYEASETTPLDYSETTPVNSVNSVSPVSNEFSTAWMKIQEALQRNELTRAHLLASQWHGAPTLTAAQKNDVDKLLSELAGTVVYSLEHRLEPAYTVRAGETLESIAQQYSVPWELLAKINGIATSDGVEPGQMLKVVRGPFDAEVVLSSGELVLMLDDRFAGKFPVQIDGIIGSSTTWRVDQKQILPSGGTTGRMLVLRNDQGASFTLSDMPTPDQTHKGQLRVASNDASDLYDILSVGSVVSIRR